MIKKPINTILISTLLLGNFAMIPLFKTKLIQAEVAEATTTIASSTENVKVTANINQAFTPDEAGILTVQIEGLDSSNIKKITADASSLGEPKLITISPELLKITVTATDNIQPGKYPIEVTVQDKNDQDYQTTVEAEVLPVQEEHSRSWDEEVIYFMLTDRFNDGDKSNNNPNGLPYDQAKNQGGVYHGGDFKGITEKLDYLKELGITMIWITPIVQNIEHNVEGGTTGEYYGYHGYWAEDFESLNPHLGTLEDFHHLIDAAAERDISIMVDVVLNHAGYGMDQATASSKEGFPSVENRNKLEGMLRTDKNRRPGDQVLDGLSGLPDFATEEAEVRNQLVAWQTNWLKLSTTEKDNRIKAFRVDTVKHVENTTWQHFKNELIAIAPDFHLIGEVWDAQFNRLNTQLGNGMMDSLLDFGFKNIAAGFANGYFETNQKLLEERNQTLTSSRTMGQFLSSHDEDGFLYKMVNQDKGKFMIAATLQMTSKGQPVIYYGEELGQSGANNWPIYDNRYDFDWENIDNNPILLHYQKLLAFRKQFVNILTDGDLQSVAGSKEQEWYMTSRQLNNEQVYIIYNVKDQAQTIKIEVERETTKLVDHYNQTEYLPKQDEAGKWQIDYTIKPRQEGGTGLVTIENGKLISVQ